MGSTFAVKLFLRGVRAPIYLSEPTFETVASQLATLMSPARLRGLLTTGQPFIIDIGEIVTAYGPEPGEEEPKITLSFTSSEFRALEMAYGHGEAALEAYVDEWDAVGAGKSVRTKLDAVQVNTEDQGDAEDQENAKVWLEQKGDVPKAIKTAGPDFVAGWLAEASFGPDVRIALKDGRTGLIVGFDDDESGHPSKGRFAIDIITADEESPQYVPTNETIGVGIDDIAGVITYDNDEYMRGGVEPLEWKD